MATTPGSIPFSQIHFSRVRPVMDDGTLGPEQWSLGAPELGQSTIGAPTMEACLAAAIAYCGSRGLLAAFQDDTLEEEERQRYVAAAAEHCHCRAIHGPCEGVLTGGICDNVQDKEPWHSHDDDE